jgi:serine/threonine protein kinase
MGAKGRLLHVLCKEGAIPRELIAYVRDLLGDRYVVDEEIAAGGAARVFRAKEFASRKPVALKVLRPELMSSLTAQRFLREIEVLKQLDHPLISKLLDFGEADWFLYYVMDWVEGPTLRQYLNEHRQAAVDQAVKGTAEVLSAVAHAHARGIVYRDVKPENVLLSPKGAILVDFGIARAIAHSESQRVTRSGFTVGTSAYMSPEQAMGDPVDERSDLYSIGCVLYESLAGRPPFSHPLESQVMQLHQKAPAPRVSAVRADVPPLVAEVIARALSKDPRERWQTADQMREALVEAFAGGAVAVKRSRWWSR